MKAPEKVVASFDSATTFHAAINAALRGEPFPHLGHGPTAGAAVRLAGRLPWPLLRRLYITIGASEGVQTDDLPDVDMNAVAAWLASGPPQRRYPAVMLGCSNGALAHLAAAMQAPWLPGTVLIPVARTGDPDRPIDTLRFGERVGPAFLEANPDVVLHHMHDRVQDELMVARMTYFRVKWQGMPAAYTRFLESHLAPGGPVILAQDRSRWPVVRVADRHVFQVGAQGGVPPEWYLKRPHTPRVDDGAAEAEWGSDTGFESAVAAWCAAHRHPLVRVSYEGPQAPASAVADTMRRWYRERDEPGSRLLVSSFVVGDPWRTVNAGAVPFWTYFPVEEAFRSLQHHLAASPPYRQIDILMFQHGVQSVGAVDARRWMGIGTKTGARTRLIAVDPRRSPHDIGSLGRYGGELQRLPPAQAPWSPMPVGTALRGLAADSAVDVTRVGDSA